MSSGGVKPPPFWGIDRRSAQKYKPSRNHLYRYSRCTTLDATTSQNSKTRVTKPFQLSQYLSVRSLP
jgi:hypothetical protein